MNVYRRYFVDVATQRSISPYSPLVFFAPILFFRAILNLVPKITFITHQSLQPSRLCFLYLPHSLAHTYVRACVRVSVRAHSAIHVLALTVIL